MRRKGSSNIQFVQRIPADVREKAIGQTIEIPIGAGSISVKITASMNSVRISLQTSSPKEAKSRHSKALAYVDAFFESLRHNQPTEITAKMATALAGEIYKGWAEPDRSRRISIVHTPEGWVRDDYVTESEAKAEFEAGASFFEKLGDEPEASELEALIGPIVTRILAQRGIHSTDPASRERVLRASFRAIREGMETAARRAGGDYGKDTNAERFPDWHAPSKTVGLSDKSLLRTPTKGTITELYEGWKREAEASGRSQSTFDSYEHAIRNLIKFLKHDDAALLTEEAMIAYKDFRLASINPKTNKRLSVKTFKGSDLSAFNSIFGWAVANKKLAANPAAIIKVKSAKKVKLRERDFTPEEASAILAAADLKASDTKTKGKAALRWVPWLCAYTGARLGEIVQLRKQDIRKVGDDWIITLTPEAGTIKTKDLREVPVHPHLIEKGFGEHVSGMPEGYLFLDPAKDGTIRGPLRGRKNRLADFARTIVTDPNVAPNHGWRHTFKSIGISAGIQEVLLDAICGHKSQTEGRKYIHPSIDAKVEAVKRFPRYQTGHLHSL
jgi:integrase